MININSIQHAFTQQELNMIRAAMEQYVAAHSFNKNEQVKAEHLLNCIRIASALKRDGI